MKNKDELNEINKTVPVLKVIERIRQGKIDKLNEAIICRTQNAVQPICILLVLSYKKKHC